MQIKQETDIVIVGGGLSGLAAALECQQQRCSFVILEARDRPGGRLHSIKLPDGISIDIGAQWVGRTHYALKALIHKFQLHTTKTSQSGKSIYEIQGKIHTVKWLPPLSLSGLLDLYRFKWIVARKIRELSTAEHPLASHDAYKLDQQTVGDFISSHLSAKDSRAYYQMIAEELLCSGADEISALDLLWCIQSTASTNFMLHAEQEWIIEGAQTLAERMAGALGDGIIYENPVKLIEYENDHAVVHTSHAFWKTKKVIVAVPPNLMQHIEFSPPLPSAYQQLFEHSRMPSVVKMIYVYQRPFWRNKGLSGVVFSSNAPAIFAMDSSPPDGRKGILSVISTGVNARSLAAFDASDRRKLVARKLSMLLGSEAASPEAFHEKLWAEDEWARGGYGTHYAPGVLTRWGDVLGKSESALYWAGTESSAIWRTYMEGAVRAGQKAAKDAIRALHRPSLKDTSCSD